MEFHKYAQRRAGRFSVSGAFCPWTLTVCQFAERLKQPLVASERA